MTIGEIIRSRREERSWTTSYLAARVGVTRQAVQDLERGYHPNVGIRTIALYAAAFGLTPAQLIEGYTPEPHKLRCGRRHRKENIE